MEGKKMMGRILDIFYDVIDNDVLYTNFLAF